MDVANQPPAAQDAAAQQPTFDEVAISVASLDITIPFMGALRDVQDTVLRRLGANYDAYRELRRDDQVHACFQQRRLALMGRPLIVKPGADDPQSVAAADWLRLNLSQIPFDRTCGTKIWGAFYGHSVAECMWSQREAKIWLDKPKVRTPWRFRFTHEGELRLLTRSNQVTGEPLPPRKFWTTSWNADNDDEPYGLGLAHQLYWPVFFKKQGLGFWLRALEKYGAPSTVAKYPAGSGKDVRDQALQVARQLRLDGAAAIPDTMVVDLLEATRGTVDQATFLRQMNASIAKIILGQTMTTDDGASLSQSQVHMGVREELTDADAELQCESFQAGPATWLTQWNFPGAAVPQISRPSPEDEAASAELLEKKAKAVAALRDAGLEPESDEVIQAFVGPGWKLTAKPAAKRPLTGPAFAESASAGDAIDAFVDDLDWEPMMTPIRDRLVAFVEAQPDLQTAADQLGVLLADPAGGQLVEQIGRSLFEARMAGLAGGALSAEMAAADDASA
ncbi:phage portal protein family protein [Caulobacter henricii]|uniref:Portal protein n=1 Tax=Caulobacter henricii TaxID=69395 RepID=A0A0P0P180_9CAUL|nr:DUF935 family protein [Caulobacter henricii]ALL14271.1 hypothetical protein AQ619_13475 [Caulobacter henricii]